MDNVWIPDSDADAETSALVAAPASPRDDDERRDSDFARVVGHWRYELRRWLATLNPGRTGREYEKAVAYFFQTPGVPQEVAALTFDLLLAYRGALALRATDPARGTPRTSAGGAMPDPRRAMLAAPSHATLIGDDGAGTRQSNADGDADDVSAPTPLAPATVNIRLTALRQFLVHCSMMGTLTDLSPDRIRMALKRLRIDRRRPYQILAESEWEEFLAAAALPATVRPTAAEAGTSASPAPEAAEAVRRRSPWGIPRAARVRQTEALQAMTADRAASDMTEVPGPPAQLPRSRAGLTGERTAQRDRVLIALVLATGLRAIEISLLDLGDLMREWHDGQEEWWLVLPDAKTKGQHGGRTLPLAASLVVELLAYVRSTDRRLDSASDRSTPLFLSSRGANDAHNHVSARRSLTPGQIGRIVDRVETQWIRSMGASAGESRTISPHALRHSTAMALLQGSADGKRPPASVEHVRGWLGHFDIRTTQGYLAHLDSRSHRRALKIAPPVGAESDRTGHADQHDTKRKDDNSDRALQHLGDAE